jgi:hypothetical protein
MTILLTPYMVENIMIIRTDRDLFEKGILEVYFVATFTQNA